MFKMLTGGDAIKVEPKGKQAFSYKYGGGLLFACNDLPAFSTDKGGYMFDRFCIIPCDNIIPAERRDRGLLDKLKREGGRECLRGARGLKTAYKERFQLHPLPAKRVRSRRLPRPPRQRGRVPEALLYNNGQPQGQDSQVQFRLQIRTLGGPTTNAALSESET